LNLGDTRQRALEIFPQKPRIDQEHKYSNVSTCGIQYEWVNLSKQDYGANVFIQFKDGLVSQIGSMISEYHTVGGITVNTRPEHVRLYFRALRAYVLFGTESRAVGQRPLTFWVDWEKGIPFSFAYDRRRKTRVIWEIIVFDPKASFCPQGQRSAPPDWQELAPYTLEPPKEMEVRWKESASGKM